VPVYRIPKQLVFPDPALAEPSGLLGVGGDLSPRRLLLGYASGIFPWYSEGDPILWFSPDPRLVLRTADLHVPRSLGKRIRRRDYRVTLDQAFPEVLRGCKEVYRPAQGGSTWITADMEKAYLELWRLGFVHSVESWQGDELVGGLYGVTLGGFFGGESMFNRRPDASKAAVMHMMERLRAGGFVLCDAQVPTPHLTRLGTIEVPRKQYLERLARALKVEARFA